MFVAELVAPSLDLKYDRCTHVKLSLFLLSRSEELRKEARQLKKELLAIKQRKEESSKPAVVEEKEGMEARPSIALRGLVARR